MTEAQTAAVKAAMTTFQQIIAGSCHTGIWRDETGTECEEGDDLATFEEFTLEEQNTQLETVTEQAEAALEILSKAFGVPT